MELIHPSLDNDLGGSWRSAGDQISGRPTPGTVNSIYSTNAPPQIRQVDVDPARSRFPELTWCWRQGVTDPQEFLTSRCNISWWIRETTF
ncbi:MAG: hypothetical protein R3C28_10915 [Pirellulaceae bacterium]